MYKDQRFLRQHLHGALVRSGNHLDKISLKPALVDKRWLATFIMICKLGLVQGRAEVLWCLGPGATAWLYAPYQMLIMRNVKIQAQQNYLPQPLPHAKALRHKSFTSSENKEAKNLSETRTTLRNNSKTLECCENNFCMALLTRKKWNTFLMPELCSKERGAFWTESYFLGAEVY